MVKPISQFAVVHHLDEVVLVEDLDVRVVLDFLGKLLPLLVDFARLVEVMYPL